MPILSIGTGPGREHKRPRLRGRTEPARSGWRDRHPRRTGARAQLKCESRLAVIPGETHLFEEPGALDQVTDLAGDWFGRHFARVSHIAPAA